MAKFTAVRIASAVTLPEAQCCYKSVTFSVTKFAAVTTFASAVKLPSPDFGLIDLVTSSSSLKMKRFYILTFFFGSFEQITNVGIGG